MRSKGGGGGHSGGTKFSKGSLHGQDSVLFGLRSKGEGGGGGGVIYIPLLMLFKIELSRKGNRPLELGEIPGLTPLNETQVCVDSRLFLFWFAEVAAVASAWIYLSA